jgi:hypothetical protein
LNTGELLLDISVTPVGVENPIGFEGIASLSINNGSWRDFFSNQSESFDTIYFQGLVFDFDGRFFDSPADTAQASSYAARLMVSANNVDQVEFTESKQSLFSTLSTLTGETEQAYIDTSVNVMLEASLPGLEQPLQVVLSSERDGLESGFLAEGSRIDFGNKIIAIEGAYTDQTGAAIIRNQDNVEIDLFEQNAQGRFGTIRVDDNAIGWLENTSLGARAVFNNGLFESVY